MLPPSQDTRPPTIVSCNNCTLYPIYLSCIPINMPPRSRYAVDPSLSAPSGYGQQSGQISQSTSPQPQYNQQSYQQDPNYVPQLHPVSDRRTPPPTGEYAPVQAPRQRNYGEPEPTQFQQFQQPQQQQQQHQNFAPPINHIPAPPHSSGPQMAGPRVRIDPSQVPNPVEAQELDQNLYDDDDFLSCEPRGVMPLAGTDYRGVDQGMFYRYQPSLNWQATLFHVIYDQHSCVYLPMLSYSRRQLYLWQSLSSHSPNYDMMKHQSH